MDPHQQYRRNSSYGWTRIDMLLHIYNHTINSLQNGADLLKAGASPAEMITARMDAQKKILLISDGLAVDQGGTPVQIMRLCVYALDQIQTDSPDAWESAAHVLSKVREGFEGIQEAAREAERAGEISALNHAAG
jgi:flagellar protein FliS